MKNLDPKSPLWDLSFRPFFLFGSLFSIAAITLWVVGLSGHAPLLGYLNPMIWHAHEMIYGFSTSIIAGFVLTASQNWTGIRGVHGRKLQILFLVWLAGRIALLSSREPSLVAAILGLGFYPLLASYLFPYLRDPDLKVERVFILFFALFFTGDLLVHLESFGVVHGLALKGLLLGLNTVTLVIVFMGGRVIPFFTESSIAKSQPVIRQWVEVSSHVSAWLFLLTQFFAPDTLLAAVIAFFAAGIHLTRLVGWQVPRIRRVPLLWVLHLAYLWLVIGFFLSGLAALQAVPVTVAVHAFTVGGLGAMIYGMISRVSLGHTGRPLRPSVWIVTGYYCLNAAAVIRVFGPILTPGSYLWALSLSGALWITAFSLFTYVYAPMLITPRAQ